MSNAYNEAIGRRLLRLLVALFAVIAMAVTGLPSSTAQEAAEPIPAQQTTTDRATAEQIIPEQQAPRETVPPAAETAPAPETIPSRDEVPEREDGAADEVGDEDGELPPGIPESEVTDGMVRIDAPASRSRMGTMQDRPSWVIPEPGANPAMPEKCGLKIALVFDVSNSIGDSGLASSQEAGRAIINGLKGTPTELGLFNFATIAPAVPAATQSEPLSILDPNGPNVSTLLGKVNQLAIGNPGGTNWEGGLGQIPLETYDVVYFITDGVPTTNNAQTGVDLGTQTHAADVTDAVAAANALKAGGTRVVPIAVGLGTAAINVLNNNVEIWRGSGVNGGLYYYNGGIHQMRSGWLSNVTNQYNLWRTDRTTPQQMLDFVSSPGITINVANYDALVQALKEQILAPCEGTLNVVKTIVDAEGNVIADGDVKGWEFRAQTEGDVIKDGADRRNDVTRLTDDEGTVTYVIDSEEEQNITVTETQQPGFILHQQGGKNAVCRETFDGEVTDLTVTNDGETGFRVTMPAHGPLLGTVTCEVQNRELPAASINKEPTAGDPVRVNPDGTAELTYTVNVVNPNAGDDITADNPMEIVRLPEGVVADGDATVVFEDNADATVTGGISTIPQADLVPGNEVTLADSIALKAGATQTITVTIPVKVTDPATADWERLGKCEGEEGTLFDTGVPNSVDMEGDEDKSDNNACIPLLPPTGAAMTINKVDMDDEGTPLEGAMFRLYAAGDDGDIDWNNPVTDEGAANGELGTGLLPGDYFLVETRAPEGYTLLARPVKITVAAHKDGYSAVLADPSDAGLVEVGPGPDAPSYQLVVRVADVRSGTLPKTGGTGVLPYALVAAALFAAALAGGRRFGRQ